MNHAAAGWLCLALAAVFVPGGCASHDADSNTLVLRNVRVVDGYGGRPGPPVDVAIESGRIAAIGNALPAEARELDLSGHYLLPGFIDLHVHLPPDRAVQDRIVAQLLHYGVTTFLNPGARVGSGTSLRDRLGPREPRMMTAGRIIEYRAGDEDIDAWAESVQSADDAVAAVERQAAAGVDFIKFYTGLPPDWVGAVVDAAHASGLAVIGHTRETGWREAARLGVDMLVHSGYGTPMDELVDLPDAANASDADWYAAYADAPGRAPFDALVRQLLAHDVTVVPTLAITQAAGLGRDATLLPRFETHLAPEADLEGWWPEGWRRRHPQYGDDVGEEEARLLEAIYWPGVLGIVNAYYERGVTLGVGTDVGNAWIAPGTSYHYEMSLYAEAGIPAQAIIRMATRNGAKALGLLDDIGTVEVGKVADLVVLDADPTVDIANTRRIALVIRSGAVVSRGQHPSTGIEGR